MDKHEEGGKCDDEKRKDDEVGDVTDGEDDADKDGNGNDDVFDMVTVRL